MDNIRREQMHQFDNAFCEAKDKLEAMIYDACEIWDAMSDEERQSEYGLAIDRFIKVLSMAEMNFSDTFEELDDQVYPVLDELEPVEDLDDEDEENVA